ncbi:MAG TPA: adenylate/guanylate cyclase domain-containing protein [Candidatus Binatia bacterium]|nr:adenylate/guanylate cyclase domain-containing protein [Candidatus Binatia bacterium]
MPEGSAVSACPKCRADNPAGARFCNQCGQKLDAGAPAPQRAYTPKHLAEKIFRSRGAMQGEKKRVTVLFADIKGSTRLAEQAGAEAWHGILDRFFQILSEGVHRYEGTVNQYTGDGIMALFGAPIAHEDHAQRACFAALAMQAEVRRFADELRLRQGLNLSMRVGLNTGEVIVGRIGDDLRMDYTAQGLTVNLAARMEHICEPGRVYLTRHTAMLVEGYFRLRDLGEMKVDGASAPVAVSELEGEGHLRTRLQRQLARMGSRFVGREPEMAALHEAFARVRGGHGQVLAVIGNAGIGKSRLCHEFAEGLARAGVPVHRATGVPYSGALPLYPVQTLTRSRLRLPERCADEEVRRLVAGTFLLQDPANAAALPSILEFLGVGDAQARAPDQAAAAREKMLALLARWLPRAEQGVPQLLLVEDLHFADPGTEDFVARLCAEVAATPTLLLLNYRPEYVSERLLPRLDEQIQVTALTAVQIADLVRAAIGTDPSLGGVAERIAQRASGNPYYAEEAVQALVDEGHVTGERAAYVLARPIESWRIPDTVHALISARIDRLPHEHKALLQGAAVIGQDFAAELLAQLAALEPEPLEAGLGVLEECGFVHVRDEADPPHWRFCHPLVQEVAYHSQLESQRAAAHARLAQALETRHPPAALPTEEALQIAHHWACAGEWARAGAWNLQASRWAAAHDMNETGRQFRLAMQHFDRAADAPDVIKGRIAARAGIVRMVQFLPMSEGEVERIFRDALAMAEKTRDLPGIAELYLSYANEMLHRGDAEAAVRYAGDAVRRAMAVGAGEMVHRFRLAVLLVFNSAGFPREGLDLVNAAAGQGWMTEPIGQENYMSRGFYGLMLAALGDVVEAERNVREAVAFAEKEDRSASWMYANLVDIAWFSGRPERAMAEARRAVERAEAFGSPFFRAIALRALGMAHCLTGNPAEVIPLLEAARPIVAPGGLAHQFEANYLAVLAECYLHAGRIDEAVRAAEEGIGTATRTRSRVWEARAWVSWLELPADESRRARAEEGLARLQSLIDRNGAEGLRPWLLLGRARWARSQAEAAQHRAEAVEQFRRIGAAGHVQRLQGGEDQLRPGPAAVGRAEG